MNSNTKYLFVAVVLLTISGSLFFVQNKFLSPHPMSVQDFIASDPDYRSCGNSEDGFRCFEEAMQDCQKISLLQSETAFRIKGPGISMENCEIEIYLPNALSLRERTRSIADHSFICQLPKSVEIITVLQPVLYEILKDEDFGYSCVISESRYSQK